MCRALLRFPHLSFIPPVPYSPLRGTFPLRGRLCIGDSDSLANGALETISHSLSYRHCPIRLASLATFPTRGRFCPSLFFFPHMRVFALTMREKRHSRIVVAFPLGEGAVERSEAGLASFFAAKPPPLCLPHRGRGTASAVHRVLSYIVDLRRSPPLFFIPLSSIQPPPLRGTSFHRKEGVSTRAPSLGRGCRAQRGGVGFLFCGEAASSLPSPSGKGDRVSGG